MKTAFVTVGMKRGDCLSVLPIIHERFKRTGEKQIVVSTKNQAEILEAAPYVEQDVFPGEWFALRESLQYAKKKYRHVIALATFGQDFPIHQRCPSFQHDQWLRAGMLDQFGKLPLVLNVNGEVKKRDDILVFCNSESSPFPHTKDLLDSLSAAFPGRVTVASVNKSAFIEMLPEMRAAKAVVSIDTGALHLSAACDTPVFAFVTDKPTRWHGSAYHPRFYFHCRYGDYQRRKAEFIHSLGLVMQDTSRPKTWEIEGIFSGGYNPSIIEFEGKTLMAYRYHEPNGISRLAMAELDSNWKVRRNAPIDMNVDGSERLSFEDPHLFIHSGRLHVSFTSARFPMPPFRCVVAYGALEKRDGQWNLMGYLQPKYGNNDFSGMNKNWCPFEADGKLHFIYSGDPHTVIEVQGERAVKEYKIDAPKWNYGTPKGGVVVPMGNNHFMRYFHARTDDGDKPYFWEYRIGWMVMENTPPFKVTSINQFPVVWGDEELKNIRFWKPCVCFPAGAIQRNGKTYLSYGKNDTSCRVVEL